MATHETDDSRKPSADQLLLGLDPQQREAVTAPVGTVVVRAGAGSGKTTVLTKRIAWRVVGGTADIEHVLAITFTRQAAGELRRRLRTLHVDNSADAYRPASFTAGTFHAVAQRLLAQRFDDTRRERPRIITNRLGLLTSVASPNANSRSIPDLMAAIDFAHARRLAPSDVARELARHGRKLPVSDALFADIWSRYEKTKRKRGVVDFDDLMTLVIEEASRDGAFLESIRWQFRHVHVDEAQDLNPLQYEFLRLIVGTTPDLFIVGDPHQAIYGWNGAEPDLFDTLPGIGGGTYAVNLPSNYRCTPQIVDSAVHVLRNSGHDANEASRRSDGPAVKLVRCVDEHAEQRNLVSVVRAFHEKTNTWDAIAVLARTNAHVAELSDALRHARIPVRQSQFARGLRSAVDEASSLGSRHALTVWATDILDFDDDSPTDTDDQPSRGDAPRDDSRHDDLRHVAERVREYLHVQPHGLVDGRSFTTWFNTIATAREDSGVEVLTFHAAKGREWPAVFVAGVEVGMLPHSSAGSASAKQEEGRLGYVALTRAANHLAVAWTDKRGSKRTGPSPLIRQIPVGEIRESEPPSEFRNQQRTANGPSAEFIALDRWRHDAARAANCDVEAILTTSELRALAANPPHTRDDVVAVVGTIVGDRIAARVLRALESL